MNTIHLGTIRNQISSVTAQPVIFAAPLAIYYVIFLQFVLLWSHGAILLKHSPCMMGHDGVVFSAGGYYLLVVDATLPSRLQLR